MTRFSLNNIPWRTHGVYVVYENNLCVYVGQSRCVRSRVISHITAGKFGIDAQIRVIKTDNPNGRFFLELCLISVFRPTLNKTNPLPLDVILYCVNTDGWISSKQLAETHGIGVCVIDTIRNKARKRNLVY